MATKEVPYQNSPAYQRLNRAHEDALREQQSLERQLAAQFRTLNDMRKSGIASFTDDEYREITDSLHAGEWPERLLGPLENADDAHHQMHSTDFIRHARRAHELFRLLDAAREAVRHALEALQNWIKSWTPAMPCGAPCTSRGREGKPCAHPLTARRHCPNHGQRPPLAATVAA